MAIQRLDFYGYRSFQQATWEPGNLNLLVGPNGCKSGWRRID